MNEKRKLDKLNWFLLASGYFVGGYLLINWLSEGRSHYYDVSFAFEQQIPFIPVFIFGYLLVYLSLILLAVIIRDARDWQVALISFFVSTTVAYIVFLLMPVKMELRPNLEGLSGISIAITRLQYFVDNPYNLFPSLHVTYPTLATVVSWRNHHIMRWTFLFMAIAVAVSVVLVKQHYIADVIAGFANATLCFLFAVWIQGYLKKRQTPSAA